ncbi:MAG TPA: hypothetical protein VFK07_01090 [Candidatus Paceibacterota bacterium]|nr:hypothetical protein [Candidatus Paceibacterota bacterium]
MSKRQVRMAQRPVSPIRVQRLLRQDQFRFVLMALHKFERGAVARLENGAEILFRKFGGKIKTFIRSRSRRKRAEVFKAMTCKRRHIDIVDIVPA